MGGIANRGAIGGATTTVGRTKQGLDLDALRLPGSVGSGPAVVTTGPASVTVGAVRVSLFSRESLSPPAVQEWGIVPSDRAISGRFLRVPWRTFCRACATLSAPHAVVALSLFENFHPKWPSFRPLPQGSLAHLPFSDRTIRRALAAAEVGGLIRTLRRPGQRIALQLVADWGDRQFVPPVPLEVIQAAAQICPSAALLLLAVIRWSTIGRAKPFVLSRRRYGEISMPQTTARRSMVTLIDAGLIERTSVGRIVAARHTRPERPEREAPHVHEGNEHTRT